MKENENYNYQRNTDEISDESRYTKDEAQNFWKDPIKSDEQDKGKNDPKDYLSFKDRRSPVLLEILDHYVKDRDLKILELGPNAGRNLNYLYVNGYKKLSGIEINPNAVSLLKKEFPLLSENIELSSLEDSLPRKKSDEYDVVFSMAVLEHISKESEFIFNEIQRISSSFIITIEDETTNWSIRHFPRNYKEVFESESWKEIFSANCKEYDCLDDRFFIRVFRKQT